jgi:hypothetical protein
MNNKKIEEKEDDKPIDVAKQMQRLVHFFGAEDVKSMFAKLDIKLSTYSNYYSRGKLPTRLINRLQSEFQINPAWLNYGEGASVLIPKLTKYGKIFDVIEAPQDQYHAPLCAVVCDAISKREDQELVVSEVLKFINSLNVPLKKKTEDKSEKKE